MTVLLIVLLPFLGALLPTPALRFGRHASALAAALPTAVALLLLLTQAPRVFAGEVVLASWPWIPAIGLNLAFMIDGLGFLFAFLITAIGLLIILYARYYLSPTDPMGRFYSYLMLFMGSMLGVVLADNILLLIVFWELTSVSSFLLIGYWSHRADARQGARMALAVTGGGGLALLAGFLLLGNVAGSYELSVILERGDLIRQHALYLPILILVLLGAFTKSAQFPFHFWLPHAMAAPTPVSAYLHSATMVKAGVFLLARVHPALAGTFEWLLIVATVGLITMVFAAYVALFKDDLKGLLAYSTVSHLGLITMLFGLSVPTAAVAGVFHIINHATFKASLFMAAGIIDHETGTRDMRRLGGLIHAMPITATLAMIGAAAMAGVPLFNGFLSKEMMLTAVIEVAEIELVDWMFPVLVTLGTMMSVAYSIRFIHDVFFGPVRHDLPRTPHEPPRWMRVPVEVLIVLCIAVGILPAAIVGPLLAVAAGATIGGPLPDYSLAIWHGFTLALLLSALAMAGGVLVYTQRHHLVALHDRLPQIQAKTIFDAVVASLVAASTWFTATLHTNSLQRYLACLLVASLVLGVAGFWDAAFTLGPVPGTPIDLVSAAAWVMLVAASIGTAALHRRRLVAIVLAGLVGLIVSLAFVHFSAPDLALTQLSVEIVTIVLLLLALNLLPQESPVDSTRVRRGRDLAIAGASGVAVTLGILAVLTRPFQSISWYHLENSVPGGGGTNVVNVILVDFRGFDTLGEIIVLAIAAIGIYATLISLLTGPARHRLIAFRSWAVKAQDSHPMILVVVTRVLLPMALLVSMYLLLRGHNLPGGGFIAGLVTSVALIMQYMANGMEWTEQRLRMDYHRVIAVGVLLAGLTGVGSWLFGYPYLTSWHAHVHWPIVGEFELASAMAFDVGVYLTVVGAAMLALANLGRIEAGTHKRVVTRSIAWLPDEPGARAGAIAAKADVVPARAGEP
jgi:multicomponent K+:H+ antiporter subunit A